MGVGGGGVEREPPAADGADPEPTAAEVEGTCGSGTGAGGPVDARCDDGDRDSKDGAIPGVGKADGRMLTVRWYEHDCRDRESKRKCSRGAESESTCRWRNRAGCLFLWEKGAWPHRLSVEQL